MRCGVLWRGSEIGEGLVFPEGLQVHWVSGVDDARYEFIFSF